jgi:hypothetical protein
MDNNTPPPIIGSATLLSAADKAWLDHYAEEQRKTPARLEEVAKYLTGIISICITIFIDKKPANLTPWSVHGLTLAAVFWVAAAVMTFIVMLPMRYRYNDASAESTKALHQRIVRRKYGLLLFAGLLFLMGLILALYLFRYGYPVVSTPPQMPPKQ